MEMSPNPPEKGSDPPPSARTFEIRRPPTSLLWSCIIIVQYSILSADVNAFITAPSSQNVRLAISRTRTVSGAFGVALVGNGNEPPSRSWLWPRRRSQPQKSTENDADTGGGAGWEGTNKGAPFDLATALLCGGLAFDAYAEPPSNSSRWEKGSQGMNVAFQSAAYTRNLYKGLVEVTPIKCTDLPDEDDATESVLTGGGVDAYLMVAVVEGKWDEDVKVLEKTEYHSGVMELVGSAHVGRSSTAWSNVNENKAKAMRKKGGTTSYHLKSSWGKGGQAIWDADPPFYLYVQDPSEARLAFTVMDDDALGMGSIIGSASRRLSNLIPAAKETDPVKLLKAEVLKKLKEAGGDSKGLDLAKAVVQEWKGSIKLTNKPRKKDKKGQTAMGAAAGAMIAGPVGAAVGGYMASMYEGEVRGRVEVKLRYLPIPQVEVKRTKYEVTGGLPGVNWGELYERHIEQVRAGLGPDAPDPHLIGEDREFCFFIEHEKTGCSCAVYRSLEKRLIAISFRGTCEFVDLLTDASIVQSAWVDGEDVTQKGVAKVHQGFRNSLNSISRRLKELLLAAVSPGEDLSQYDLIVTGHSLGAALATLFTADVAEYGMDAGRGLPQLEPSQPWWNSLASTFMGKASEAVGADPPPPPRPKSLRMYNFGSPRVGNDAFVAKFESLLGDKIDEAYRVVNGQDIVARLPRSMSAFALGNVGYEHCAPTALISLLDEKKENGEEQEILWVEGQSDDKDCPVRDFAAIASPLESGMLLGDLLTTTQEVFQSASEREKSESSFSFGKLNQFAQKVTGRLQDLTANDIASIVGIDKKFSEREFKVIQSIVNGQALSHHMEDEYYQAMGRTCGYIALVGEELRPIGQSVVGKNVDKIPEAETHMIEDETGTYDEADLVLWDAQLEAWESEQES